MNVEQKLGFKITTSSDFQNPDYPTPPELIRKIPQFHRLASGGQPSAIKKLQKAIEQYPDCPQLKNFLLQLYKKLDKKEESYTLTLKIVALHPNYLFGKISLAQKYIHEDKCEKALEILGPKLDLKAMYPHRDTFHESEVVSFLVTASIYFSAIGDIDAAENHFEILKEVNADLAVIDNIEKHLYSARIQKNLKLWEKDRQNQIEVKVPKLKKTTASKAPTFHHEEIEWLYEYGLDLDKEDFNQILALPRKTLIQDLELVIHDSISRYGYFSKRANAMSWDDDDDNELYFAIQAVSLLSELKAEESLEVFFKILSQPEDYLSFYYGDLLTEAFWQIAYHMGANKLEACKQFVFKPGVFCHSRGAIIDMIGQLALHQPEQKPLAIEWLRDVMHFFLEAKPEDNVIDSEVVAIAICNALDINAQELKPEIKRLFEREIVAEFYCGTWENVKKDFEHPTNISPKRELCTLAEYCGKISKSGQATGEESRTFPSNSSQNATPMRTEPKVGRNDSCPCGSGKKHKKCCLNK